MSLLPASFDNSYRGLKPALWIFVLLVFVKLAMGFNTIVNGAKIATSADGIPLDRYPADAARTIVALFALVGLANVILGLLSSVALIRYRNMIPFLFALFVVEHLSRKLILRVLVIPRSGAPPAGIINTVLLTLMVVGLVLSLIPRRVRAA